MIGGDRVVAVVPARAGSKSVPGKNIRPLGGKPLIAWSIDVAKAVPAIDRVIVSTDGAEIAGVARKHGAEVYDRPAALATDAAQVTDALRDLIRTLRRERETAAIMVLLEPTAPLRLPGDVAACLDLMVARGLDSVATFKEADLNPHRAWKLVDGRPETFLPGVDPWQRRQALPAAHQLNGAVYVFSIDGLMEGAGKGGLSLLFGKTGAVAMPQERSIDIDTLLDFATAEALVAASEASSFDKLTLRQAQDEEQEITSP
ncbi:MAG: acylneuraminate cytidylyltransferase family protein [Alphaproteobacteria bacterium]|nr:acylneuraminate cytidylyltransferase family protein [Alphaproteobacteria bacterium]